MKRSAAQLLEDIRQLPPAERKWVIENLLREVTPMSDEAFAAWQKEVGEPEPGYDEWFRKGVEEALEDPSPGIPHEQVMKGLERMIRSARESRKRATILP
jgi:hypothetical protein